MFTRIYSNILTLKLSQILKELKTDLTELFADNPELLFKCEFVLEELLTNSFTHVPPTDSIDMHIQLTIDHERLYLEYREIGVEKIDFSHLLLAGQNNADEISVDKSGGLGLHLINQMVKEFSCRQDNKTRVFNIFL